MVDAPHKLALFREPGPYSRSLVALTLRLALGLLFVMSGIGKFLSMEQPPFSNPPEAEADAEAQTDGDAEDEMEESAASDASGSNEDRSGESVPYPDSINNMFRESRILGRMMPVVEIYTALLPYVEVGLGLLLVVGFLTPLVTFLINLLLLSLLFGWLDLGRAEMYANMFVYILAGLAMQWVAVVTSNYISLDGLIFGILTKPSAEAEYTRD